MKRVVSALLGLAAVIGTAALLGPAFAQPPAAPAAVAAPTGAHKNYLERCAACHDNPEPGYRTPTRQQVAEMGPDAVLEALTRGAMRAQADGLTPAELNQLVIYLTGKPPLPKVAAGPDVNLCKTQDPIKPTATDWNGWSPDSANSRYQPRPGLTKADVSKLKVKWAFSYPGKKNGQATIIGKRIFISSNAGKVYSLNADTGCVYWRIDAAGGVRATPIVAKNAKSPSGWAVYIADDRMVVRAWDAMTGKEFWQNKIDSHPRGILTASPVLHNNVLYISTSSMEETVTTEVAYACCTFRGAVVAVDTATGKTLWKTYAIPETPTPHTTVQGKTLLGPAGAAIWSTPTIDAKLGRLYVATGDSYTDVDTEYADAIIALDLKTGKMLWHEQVTKDDNFIVGCPRTGVANRPANCPAEVGPDHDFGGSPLLHTLPGGKRILMVGQKSGVLWGLDPDNKGKISWQIKLGEGSALGGIQWGITAEGNRVFAGVSDQVAGAKAKWGIYGVDATTGKLIWAKPGEQPNTCSVGRCIPAHSAALTAIPGVVFSGRLDGKLRAYDAATGDILWDFDAGKPVDTVNGVKGAVGGAIDATGVTIANGMVFQHAGYSGYGLGANGNNVLFAFTVDGK